MAYRVVAVLVLCSRWPCQVMGDNPFKPGTYETAQLVVSPEKDGSPLHSTVYFPLATGKFTTVMFFGGWYGYVLSELYSGFLESLASRGYIVIGTDPIDLMTSSNSTHGHLNLQGRQIFSGGREDRRIDEAKLVVKYFNQSDWLRQHVTNFTFAIPDWSKSAFMCHSASCDDTLMMIDERPSYIQASIFLDPFSPHSVIMKPVPSKVKTLAYLSQLSEEKPNCCIPGLGWKKIYDLMTCVKVRMEVKDFGHCDLLQPLGWDACHLSHFCKTTNNTRLPEYQNFTAGMIHAFLQWMLYGDTSMKNYIVDREFIPLPLVDLAYNTTCPS